MTEEYKTITCVCCKKIQPTKIPKILCCSLAEYQKYEFMAVMLHTGTSAMICYSCFDKLVAHADEIRKLLPEEVSQYIYFPSLKKRKG